MSYAVSPSSSILSRSQVARRNMVDCQIHPSGVIHQDILSSFAHVPREHFVPDESALVAYVDETILFKDGRFVLAPTLYARMVQALGLTSKDTILDVGCAEGYSSAVVSPLVSKVIALEGVKKHLSEAEKNWREMGFKNITGVHVSSLAKGCPEHAPYDGMIVNGAVHTIPDSLVSQLKIGGRAVLVVREKGQEIGYATLVQHFGEGRYSKRVLFDAAPPYLQGFEPANVFQF